MSLSKEWLGRGHRLSAVAGVIVLVAAGCSGAAPAATPTAAPPSAATPPAATAAPVATPSPTPEPVIIGYAGLSSEFPFVADVNTGLQAAADKAGAQLIIVDNKFDPQVALTNADDLINRKIDVVIEFQTDASIAPALCDKFTAANIKMIAIDIPHEPCAAFFGANNRLAGSIAGENLARIAKERWGDAVPDKLVLLALPQSGELVVSRTDGYVDGVRKVFPDFPDAKVVKVDGKGALQGSLTVMQDLMATLVNDKKILVGAVNDPSIVGALRAVEAAGRQDDFLMAGQNATIEARVEICNNSKTLVGSVAYLPERYGDALVPLALKLAAGETIPDDNYIDHKWIENKNLREFYPNC